jgi:hypothetical protein
MGSGTSNTSEEKPVTRKMFAKALDGSVQYPRTSRNVLYTLPTTTQNVIGEFDVDTRTYTAHLIKGHIPTGASGCILPDGSLFFSGGNSQQGHAELRAFRFTGLALESKPLMLNSHKDHAIVAVDNLVVVSSGFNERNRLTTNSEILDLGANEWTTLPGIPHPRANAAAVVLGGIVYVLGGQLSVTTTDITDNVQILDIGARIWRVARFRLPIPLSRMGVVQARHYGLVVFGGLTLEGAISTRSFLIDLESSSVSEHAELPMPQEYFQLSFPYPNAFYNGVVYGIDSRQTHIFALREGSWNIEQLKPTHMHIS